MIRALILATLTRPRLADQSHQAFASKKIRGGGAPKRRNCPVGPRHTNRCCHLLALRARPRVQRDALAFRRSTAALAEALTPSSAPGRVSWNRRVQTGGPSPAPVQRAPRGPVIMPDERGPKAARERFARPRAGTAPAPHLRSHPECALRRAGCLFSYCICDRCQGRSNLPLALS